MSAGRRLRILNIVDDVTRECLAAIPDTSISGRRVARELTALIERRGKPGMIVSDNGTEFTSNAMFSLGAGQQGRLAFHCARKADAEWLLSSRSTLEKLAVQTASGSERLCSHRRLAVAQARAVASDKDCPVL